MDSEKVIKGLQCCSTRGMATCELQGCPYYSGRYDNWNRCTNHLAADAIAILKEQPDIVRCKDCKHRPKEPNYETYENGFDIEFPEGSKCPCRCSGDGYYSWYPADNWYCGAGEWKDGEVNDNPANDRTIRNRA